MPSYLYDVHHFINDVHHFINHIHHFINHVHHCINHVHHFINLYHMNIGAYGTSYFSASGHTVICRCPRYFSADRVLLVGGYWSAPAVLHGA